MFGDLMVTNQTVTRWCAFGPTLNEWYKVDPASNILCKGDPDFHVCRGADSDLTSCFWHLQETLLQMPTRPEALTVELENLSLEMTLSDCERFANQIISFLKHVTDFRSLAVSVAFLFLSL